MVGLRNPNRMERRTLNQPRGSCPGGMPKLQLVHADHAPALLAFEQENRSYFAASVPERGDAYFAEFAQRHRELLAWQAAGTDFFHVLVGEGRHDRRSGQPDTHRGRRC